MEEQQEHQKELRSHACKPMHVADASYSVLLQSELECEEMWSGVELFKAIQSVCGVECDSHSCVSISVKILKR